MALVIRNVHLIKNLDGKCTDTDPIVQAIRNLTESVTDSLLIFFDSLQTKADETNESVSQINSNLDDTLNKLEQNQNDNQHNQTEQPDLTQLQADIPVIPLIYLTFYQLINSIQISNAHKIKNYYLVNTIHF
jgi:predicted  nucleic acid-binding Zn-ribbon protein